MKEKNTIISIIVPVYNVEKYLRKCIESILNQSYKEFELILVDDGSTDACEEICDEYKKQDNRIIVIHKQNRGLSDARNRGIEIARGKYITFIDSDDYIAEEYIQKLMFFTESMKADILISGIIDVTEKKKKLSVMSNKCSVVTKEEAYKKMLLQDEIDVCACGKIYKKEIIDDIRYPYRETYEDIKVVDKIIDKCNIIAITEYKGYFYLQRQGSIMYSKISKEKLSLLDATKKLMEKMSIEYPEIEYAGIKRHIKCSYHILGRAVYDDKFSDECEKIRENILSYKKYILESGFFSKKEKVATLILEKGLKIYKMFWKILCKLKGKKLY